jgi:hypothetical protein
MSATQKRAANRSTARQPATSWKSAGSPDQLGDADQLAHAIMAERSDLLPSLERIMTAALDSAGRLRALELFQAALRDPSDACRDPRVAIERCITG